MTEVVTPQMIAAGWACLRRARMPHLGPGPGLIEAYKAMRALAPDEASIERETLRDVRDAIYHPVNALSIQDTIWMSNGAGTVVDAITIALGDDWDDNNAAASSEE